MLLFFYNAVIISTAQKILLIGLKIGCSCHDFINPNGYGQCKKSSSYEHVKNKAVCYVNQPSSCSDLAYSSTNPGKKFSAEACRIEINGTSKGS